MKKGFDNDLYLKVQSKKYKQAGNTVATPLIERVASELVDYFINNPK